MNYVKTPNVHDMIIFRLIYHLKLSFKRVTTALTQIFYYQLFLTNDQHFQFLKLDIDTSNLSSFD